MVSSECKRQEPTEHGSRQTLTRAGGGQTTKLESSLTSLSVYLLSSSHSTFLLPFAIEAPFFYTFFFPFPFPFFNFPLLVFEADQMMKCNLFKVTLRGGKKRKISVKKLLSDRAV